MDPLERSTTQGNAFVLENMDGGKRTYNTLSSFPLYPVQSHARVPIIEEFLSTTMRACERNLRLQIPTSTSFVLFQFCRQHASFDFCRSLRTFFLWNEPGWPCHHGSVGGPPVEPTRTHPRDRHRRDRHAGKKIKDAQNVRLPWMRQISDFRGAYVEGRKAEFFSQHAREGMVSVKTKVWASRMQHHTV